MKRVGNTSFQSEPYSKPRATAIYRVITVEPQIVFVCESCDEIHTSGEQVALFADEPSTVVPAGTHGPRDARSSRAEASDANPPNEPNAHSTARQRE